MQNEQRDDVQSIMTKLYAQSVTAPFVSLMEKLLFTSFEAFLVVNNNPNDSGWFKSFIQYHLNRGLPINSALIKKIRRAYVKWRAKYLN